MAKFSLTKIKNRQFPIIVEKDEDGFYVAECPLFQGCYSQGRTMDECLKNIRKEKKVSGTFYCDEFLIGIPKPHCNINKIVLQS